MVGPWSQWSHLLKIDPDRTLPDEVSYADLAATGTDAFVLGGTTGITPTKMAETIDACRDLDVALLQEPSNPDSVVLDGAIDGYLVPIVLNAGDVFWVTGAHADWLRRGGRIDWSVTTTEAYIVLNADSSVATYTDARCDLDAEAVAAYATVAERLLGQSIVYIEYSGTFGDPAIVSAARDALEEAVVFYGGGIRTYEQAATMAAAADVIVVGNALYEDGLEAVSATVSGANKPD